MGNFIAGGAQYGVDQGRLKIVREGKVGKFVDKVAQVTFSGRVAAEQRKEVL